MNLEKVTVRFKIIRIVRKQPITGPVLLEIYATVLSYHPFRGLLKEAKVTSPLCCVTERHLLPTQEGYIPASELKGGEIIFLELPLIVQ